MVEYISQIIVFVAIFAILASSLNLVLGYGGILSVMHAVFFGVGAYAAAQMTLQLGAPFPLELIAGFIMAALLAGLIVTPMVRLSEYYVIIGTLALQLVLSNVFVNWQGATGGSYGLYGIPKPMILGIEIISLPGYALFASAMAFVCFVVLWLVVRSPLGLSLKGLREDEVLAQSFGKDVRRQRIIVFALGSGLAGVAGGIYARFVGYIEPHTFDMNQSLSIVTIAVVGGLGNLWGSLAGAVLLMTVPQLLRFSPATGNYVAHIQLLLFGLLLIVVLRLRPQGLFSERPAVRASAVTPPPAEACKEDGMGLLWQGRLPQTMGASVDLPAQKPACLEIRRLYKSFGGLMAVNDLSLSIPSGQVTAIIGPNGAGKTTVFNMITGYLKPDRGEIFYDRRELTRMQPFQIARLGIARSFQDVRIFNKLTVLENVVLAIQGNESERLPVAFTPWVSSRVQREARRRAMIQLEAFGLGHCANQKAGDLSYAQQKILVVVGLAARGDPFLLLDELAAGMDHESVGALAQLVRQLAVEGRTICLIEHNLEFVWQSADTVMVLDQGQLIAQGSPAEVQRDRRAIQVYFGGLVNN